MEWWVGSEVVKCIVMRLDCDRVAGQTEECFQGRGRGQGGEWGEGWGLFVFSPGHCVPADRCKIIARLRKHQQSGSRSPTQCCLVLCLVILAGNGIFKYQSEKEFYFNRDQNINHRNPFLQIDPKNVFHYLFKIFQIHSEFDHYVIICSKYQLLKWLSAKIMGMIGKLKTL